MLRSDWLLPQRTCLTTPGIKAAEMQISFSNTKLPDIFGSRVALYRMCASNRIKAVNNPYIVQIYVNMDCHFSYCRKLSNHITITAMSSRQLLWFLGSASVLLPPVFSMIMTHSALTLVGSVYRVV